MSVASCLGEDVPLALSRSVDFVREGLPARASRIAGPGTTGVRLLDQVRAAIRLRHYSRRTEKAYTGWIRRFVLFHGKRHPAEMGKDEVSRFLNHLGSKRRSASRRGTRPSARCSSSRARC
jgi:hypothetical protein